MFPKRFTRVLTVVAIVVGALVGFSVTGAQAHGGEIQVVVESLQNPDSSFGYGVVLHHEDGDLITEARVLLSATGPSGEELDGTANETADGVYIGELVFSATGVWRVQVSIETGDEGGSVAFDEIVPAPSGVGVPVVKIDTQKPERIGTPVGSDSALLGVDAAEPSLAPDVDYRVRVEALVERDIAPLSIIYGVRVDEGPAASAERVTVTASSDRGTIGPVELTPIGDEGVFRGQVDFPDAAKWAVTVDVTVDGDTHTFAFGENLPWPHYSIEAGKPKVKLDAADRGVEGTLLTIDTSPIFSYEPPREAPSTAVPETGTSTTVPLGTVTSPSDVPETSAPTVKLPSTASELTRQTILRIAHLALIGLWILGIATLAMDRRRSWAGIAAIIGIIGTLSSGAVLALYGAPTSFPGLFSWHELADRFYGSAYEVAFVIKMIGVAVAIGGTAALVAKRTRWSMLVVGSGIAVAVIGVTAMSQLHLFAHL